MLKKSSSFTGCMIALCLGLSSSGMANADPRVDVLFLFNKTDQAVVTQEATVPTRDTIVMLLKALNDTIKASGIYSNDVFFSAGYGIHQWAWSAGTDPDVQKDLMLARTKAAPYDTIWAMREKATADLVVMMGDLPNPYVSEDAGINFDAITGLLGIATANQDQSDKAYGFVFLDLVNLDNTANWLTNVKNIPTTYNEYLSETFVHEVGHTLGANHEELQIEADAGLRYKHGFNYMAADKTDNYGYVDTANKFKTIMAYAQQGTVNCLDCKPSPMLFSDPNLTVPTKSYKAGVSAGVSTKETNNAKRVKQMIPVVAGYY